MPGDGFQSIRGATRRKTALAERPEQKCFRRRNHPTIYPKPEYQDVLSHIHVAPILLNNPAFLRLVKKSLSTSPKSFPAIEGRATSTRSTGCRS